MIGQGREKGGTGGLRGGRTIGSETGGCYMAQDGLELEFLLARLAD